MRENCTYGSARGAPGNRRPYRRPYSRTRPRFPFRRPQARPPHPFPLRGPFVIVSPVRLSFGGLCAFSFLFFLKLEIVGHDSSRVVPELLRNKVPHLSYAADRRILLLTHD